MSDFEVCPVGTLQRLAAVEAELRRLHAEIAENESVINVWRGRTQRAEAERDALFQIVEAIEMALKMGIPAFEVLRASSSIRGEMQSVIAKVKGGGNG